MDDVDLGVVVIVDIILFSEDNFENVDFVERLDIFFNIFNL